MFDLTCNNFSFVEQVKRSLKFVDLCISINRFISVTGVVKSKSGSKLSVLQYSPASIIVCKKYNKSEIDLFKRYSAFLTLITILSGVTTGGVTLWFSSHEISKHKQSYNAK